MIQQKKAGVIVFFALTGIVCLALHSSTGISERQSSAIQRNLNYGSAARPDIVTSLYNELRVTGIGLSLSTFKNAYTGYCRLRASGKLKKAILTIADMGQPSCRKRLYIIDMAAQKLLVNTLVAHGRNSGDVQATAFSNTPESLQSSLGFYVTGVTYTGTNGYSLRLKGQEQGFNDQAESRSIVMHGAAYVNQEMASKTGRIGRSWGCPAVSMAEHTAIIDLIKDGSCLFVFAPQKNYAMQSTYLSGNSQTSTL